MSNVLVIRGSRDDTQRAMIAVQYGMRDFTPEILRAIAKQAKHNPYDYSVPDDIGVICRNRMLKGGLVSYKHGEYQLSKRGRKMALALAETMPNGPMQGLAMRLQDLMRDARADLDAMTQRPFFLDGWWWRSTIYNLKRWWAGTTPERPVVDMGYLKPYVAWSEEDEERQTRLWIEDHYSAFWNCPDGVRAGLDVLAKFDELAGEHRAVMPQVIDAVVAIAKLSMSLPSKHTYMPDDYDDEYDIDAMDYDPGNVRERLKEMTTQELYNTLLARRQQDQAFITINPKTRQVVAIPSALELADEQATRAVAALNGGAVKPAMWALMDEFDAVWKGQVLASQKPEVLVEEVVTRGKRVYSREVIVKNG